MGTLRYLGYSGSTHKRAATGTSSPRHVWVLWGGYSGYSGCAQERRDRHVQREAAVADEPVEDRTALHHRPYGESTRSSCCFESTREVPL